MNRDLRDPIKMGERLLQIREKTRTMHEAADLLEHEFVEDIPHHFQHDHLERYKEHLRKTGSKQALEMLEALEKGMKLEDEPSD